MSLLLLSDPPFTPKSIPGLKLWLKADAITGLVDNDPVGTWPDVSGNGNDAIQLTAAQKPLYKIAILNGYPVVRFDGVDDFCQAAGLGTIVQPLTIVMVVLTTSTATNKTPFDSIATTACTVYFNTTMRLNAGLEFTVAGDTSWHVVSAVINGTTSALVKDGVVTSGNAGTNSLTTGLRLGVSRLGSATFLPGDIAEVCLYIRALADSDRRRLESYLGSKYGITVS